MKKLIKLFMVLSCLFAVIHINTEPVKAAVKGSVSLSVSASTVTIGGNIKVTVKISCEEGCMAALTLRYNTSYVTLTDYPSGDFNPSNNKLIIDASESKSASKTFTFKTKAVGSTTFTVNVLEFYSMSGASITGYSSSVSKNVTIKNPEVVVSSDNTISKLQIENFEFEPEFSSDVTEYKIYLPKNTEKLDIKAVASSSKAKIGTIDGTVKPGWNDINIVCTAENKSQKTYVIHAYVEEEPTVFYDLGEEKLGVVINHDKVKPLEGYQPETITTEAGELTVYSNGVFDLLYLEDGQGEKNFYLYNAGTDSVISIYNPISINNHMFLEGNKEGKDFSELAETFTEENVTIGDRTFKGWGYNDPAMKDFKLLYLTDERGKTGLYRYDCKEETLQRYAEPTPPEPEIDIKPYIYLSAAISGAITLLFAMMVIARKERKARS
jgi:hypothetical protein